ncbi:MAG TPA: hypothetical protein VF121_11100 [Thermoanaerobaculia bacterium]|nr:hypothetical protein [Thermoanaerobaculia bacterium]
MSDERDSFDFQLEFLKLEFNAINEVIGRLDGIAQGTKHWAIITWAGSMVLLFNTDQKRLLALTAILPVTFWFMDAWWRSIQRSFIFRSQRISEFLNSKRLKESFQQRRLVDFIVLDPRASENEGSDEHRAFTSVVRMARSRSVSWFYLGLILLSFLIALFANQK